MRALMIFSHIAVATALIAAPGVAHAKYKSKSKSKTVVVVTKQYKGTRGHGFLPGYESPYRARREPFGQSPWVRDSTTPWYGWPGYYRGRWNGGGFGPCYTKTPIGPVWNCG